MIIDLSITINEKTPVYPGDPTTKIKPAETLDNGEWADHILTLGNHTGTHIDAPSHAFKDAKNLGDFPIDFFVGRGRYIDASGELNFDTIEAADIQAGDIVLLHTGITQYLANKDYYQNTPRIPADFINFLISKKIKMLGVDAGSVDKNDFSIHRQLLTANVLIIENLTNLDKLAGKEFMVYALPMKVELDGAPARVVAETS